MYSSTTKYQYRQLAINRGKRISRVNQLKDFLACLSILVVVITILYL